MFRINKEFKDAKVPRTVRFTEELFEALNTVAQENDISFNLLILQCCKYALENMDSLQSISGKKSQNGRL